MSHTHGHPVEVSIVGYAGETPHYKVHGRKGGRASSHTHFRSHDAKCAGCHEQAFSTALSIAYFVKSRAALFECVKERGIDYPPTVTIGRN